MNSSLSKMLDQQLLRSKKPVKEPVDHSKAVSENVVGADSLTKKIFHGDKIFLNNNAMAFKPLGMETVLESTGEHKRAGKMQTGVTRYGSAADLVTTTE